VGVRADDEREAAVEVMREGLFLAGCLGVEVADRTSQPIPSGQMASSRSTAAKGSSS